MEYTKGEWRVLASNLVVVDKNGNPQDFRIVAEPNGDSFNEKCANAQLIVEAVNACIKLNPDNPLAVAQSISDLYEALKKIIKEGIIYSGGGFEDAFKAIAKVETLDRQLNRE